jgi:hypothetical protein
MSSAEEVLVVMDDALACLVVEAISLEAELPGAVEGAVEQVQRPWSNAESVRSQAVQGAFVGVGSGTDVFSPIPLTKTGTIN